MGCKFRRQAAIGPYIVDFVGFAQRLIVELVGPQHLEPGARAHDARRTQWLAERDFRVIRFRNHEVDEDLQRVVAQIERVIAEGKEDVKGARSAAPLPNPPLRGEGAEQVTE